MTIDDQPSLTRATAEGALWIGGSLGIQIAVGVVAQVILAGLLTAHDFGLVALVMSISLITVSVSGFGISTLMAQRTPAEIGSLRAPVMRAGLWASAVCTLILAAIGPVAARLLDEPDLRWLLLVNASVLTLKPYTAVATAALQARLQFGRVAWSLLVSAVAHYVVSIVLAGAGVGAMSLVIGFQVNTVVFAAMLWVLSRDLDEIRPNPTISTREAAGLARWPLTGEVAGEAVGRIDFLMLGIFVPTRVVGIYYFAYQLVLRLNALLTGVARTVLFPALSQIVTARDERQAAGVLRAGTLLALVGGAAAAALIASMSSLEAILWSGRWEDAVPAMMLLASVAPGQAAQAAVEQLVKARGHFRRWTGIIAVRAVWSAAVALVIGFVLGDGATATGVAVAIVVFAAIETVVEVVVVGRGVGIPVGRYWAITLPIWTALVAIGWGVVWVVSGSSLGPWMATISALGMVGLLSLAVAAIAWRAGVVPRF
ncbi:MAG: oligosaccharide flippase family protein [Acidimicrobiia bacterium]|nr:oligosaccharide flippase family protein [Acidimicrobiia bacterium]